MPRLDTVLSVGAGMLIALALRFAVGAAVWLAVLVGAVSTVATGVIVTLLWDEVRTRRWRAKLERVREEYGAVIEEVSEILDELDPEGFSQGAPGLYDGHAVDILDGPWCLGLIRRCTAGDPAVV